MSVVETEQKEQGAEDEIHLKKNRFLDLLTNTDKTHFKQPQNGLKLAL